MTLVARSSPPITALPGAPFDNAEQAWFWFVRCQMVRRDGARFPATGSLHRPCDPDDIYVAVVALQRRAILHANHLSTLGRYGVRGNPPDPRCREEAAAAKLWNEALDRLTTVLRDKGIIH
ncbi:MAG: hypothetical protein U1E66_12845 [Rhodospirillales bacterium]